MALLVLDRYEFKNWISEILVENSWIISEPKHADWLAGADALSFVPLIRHSWVVSFMFRSFYLRGYITLLLLNTMLFALMWNCRWVSQQSYAVGLHHLITGLLPVALLLQWWDESDQLHGLPVCPRWQSPILFTGRSGWWPAQQQMVISVTLPCVFTCVIEHYLRTELHWTWFNECSVFGRPGFLSWPRGQLLQL